MKNTIQRAIAILILAGLATAVKAQVTTGQQVYEQVIGGIERYALYLPPSYNAEPTKKWPLLVCLHGAGERAQTANTLEENIALLWKNGVPSLINKGSTRFDEFIVVSPQTTLDHPSNGWWIGADINTLVDQIVATYSIDTDRLIVTGLSMGGYGTYKTILNQPDRYAAAAPVCPALNVNNVNEDLIDHMPIWIHHGDADPTVPYSRSVGFYNAFRSLIGGTETTNTGSIIGTDFTTLQTGHILFSTYHGVKHDSWDETYARDDVVQWMFDQTLSGANAAPQLSIEAPENSAIIVYGSTGPLQFSAIDSDGTVAITRVELNGTMIAREESASLSIPDFFDTLTPGDHTLRLSAIDNEGHETAETRSFSVLLPGTAVINETLLNGSFEDPASGTTNLTGWQDIIGETNSIERVIAPAKAAAGSASLFIGHSDTNELRGAAINTGYPVAEGDRFYLGFQWRAEKNAWDKGDDIVWRLFTTDDDSRSGTVTEIASGSVGGTDEKVYSAFWGSQTAAATASSAGRDLWIEIRGSESVAIGERALIDTVVLHAESAVPTEPSYGGDGGPPGNDYRLDFSDDFNGTSIDTNKWEVRDEDRRGHLWAPDDVYLDNGHLVLRTRENPADNDDHNYSSGAVRSKGHYETTYGYFEARCRIPKTAGGWSAFWLYSEAVKTVGDEGNDGTEIDIMETPFISSDTNDHRIVTDLHWDGYGADHKHANAKITDATFTQGSWHVFGLEWTPTEYKWYFDGELVRTSSAGGVCDVDLFVQLTSEVGWWNDAYPWGGQPIENEPLPDEFRVDWVRVWKLSETDTVPPTPNPPLWENEPVAVSASAFTMSAAAGHDPSGTVEYYFEETSGNPGGSDSGWSTTRSYTDTGLDAGTEYTYVVRMRDAAQNVGSNSAPVSATTPASVADYTVQIDFEDKDATPVVGGIWNEIAAPTGSTTLQDVAGGSTALSLGSWVNFGAGSNGEATDFDFSVMEWGESAQDSFGCNSAAQGSFTVSGFNETDTVEIRLIAIENNRRDIDFQINGNFGEGNSPFNGDDYSTRNAWANGNVASWTNLKGTNSYTITATPTDGDVPVISAMRITITPAADPNQDSDGDGLPDSLEINIGTDPNKPDSDGDGLGDLAAYALQNALPTLGNSPSGMVFNIPKTQTSNILYSVETATSLTGFWYRIAYKQPDSDWIKDIINDDTLIFPDIDLISVNTNASGVDVIDAETRSKGFYRPQFIYTP